VPIEVVPGIDARAAAAAFAGVLGRAVHVATREVAVVLADQPRASAVTIVASASTPSQRIVTTSASDAPIEAAKLEAPSVLLAFGTPDDSLRWFERRPLFGKRVLVMRPRDQSGALAILLQELGAEAVVVPLIDVRPPGNPAPLERALLGLRSGAYGWVAFTSANGVEHTWRSLIVLGQDARAFASARIAAIGPATARALEAHGLRPDLVARESRGEGIARDMIAALGSGGSRPRVLLPRASKARDALPDALRSAGCDVDIAPAYETHPVRGEAVDALASDLALGKIDAVVFTSSSTVESLCDALGARAHELLALTRVASLGPVTTQTAHARGLRVDVTALEPTVPGVVRALAQTFRPRSL
jgi:uroporphyrinogen III methyltransferase/synthase